MGRFPCVGGMDNSFIRVFNLTIVWRQLFFLSNDNYFSRYPL